MNKSLILIGGGGHCRSCIDVVKSEGKYKVNGIIDMANKVGKKVLDYKIIGSDEELKKFIEEDNYCLVTLGQIKSPGLRIEKFNLIKKLKGILPVIKASSSYVSEYSKILEGTIVMHHAFINANALISENCIINTGAVVEHDVYIGENCHISTNAVINGGVKIGANSFIGSNSVIFNGVEIANGTLVSGGSVVMRSIKESGTYMGNPARRIM